MLTRGRSNLPAMRENIGAADAVDGTNENEKRKVNPSHSSRRTKRSNDVAKVNAEQPKSKPNFDADDSPNTQKSPRKLKRTATVTKQDTKRTKSVPSKSKPPKSKPLGGAQQESPSQVRMAENGGEALTFNNAIERVLAVNYVDVQKRLKLLYPAKCIQSLVTCHKEHVRNLVRNQLIVLVCVSVNFE